MDGDRPAPRPGSSPSAEVVTAGGWSATIRRDADGWPTVTASRAEDAAFGLGWSVARDRRAQMDVLWRRAHGRLAEVWGPPAVPHDIAQRRLCLTDVAERCLRILPPRQRRLLDAFAAGTARADAVGGEGFPPWRPVHSVAVAQLLFQQLASDGAELRMVEVMRRTLPPAVVDFLLPSEDEFETAVDGSVPALPPGPVPTEELAALFSLPPRSGRVVVTDRPPVGSNAWASNRGGYAILANDMHLELTSPSLAYVARIDLPDTRVAGVTVAGLPLIFAGANEHVAWGFTRLPGDTAELIEVASGEAGDGGERRREVIRVRGGEDVTVTVQRTAHGPVVSQLAGRDLALGGTLTDPAALDFRLGDIYWADSAVRAAAVINDSGMAPVNAVVADAAGHIMWTVGGRFPDRGTAGPRGVTPAARAPAGWVPPGDLPRLLDPASGTVVTCNNGNPTVRRAKVAWNSFGGVRARRVAGVLATTDSADEAAFRRLQVDTDAGYYDFYRDVALRHLPERGTTAVLRALRAEVAAWQGTAAPDEIGLALLSVFRDVVRESLFAAVTGPCRDYDDQFVYCYHAHERPLRRMIEALDGGTVPPPWTSARHFVVGHLLLARTTLTERTGSEAPVRWGTVNTLHPIRADHAASEPTAVELAGAPEAVRVTQPDFGAAMRLVVAPGRRTGTLMVPGAAVPGAADDAALRRWAGDDDLAAPALFD